jgi:hypothetical protein
VSLRYGTRRRPLCAGATYASRNDQSAAAGIGRPVESLGTVAVEVPQQLERRAVLDTLGPHLVPEPGNFCTWI